jgi:uncharacterized repeat protein (TIGR01451 family)
VYSPPGVFGTVYFDQNENGIYDQGEVPLSNTQIHILPSNASVFTNSLGQYNYEAPVEGTYTLHPQLDEALWTSPLGLEATSVEIPSTGNAIGLNLGFTDVAAVLSTESFIIAPTALCNEEGNIKIVSYNTATAMANILYELELDESLQYLSAEITPDSIVGQVFYWHTDSIQPSQNFCFQIQVIFPAFGVPADGTIDIHLNTNASDNTGLDMEANSVNFSSTLLCAYDPNDKTELTGWSNQGYVNVENKLIYQIRFQNTGNYFATDVRIEDPISGNLDISTLQPIAWSHSVWTEITEDRKAIFHFDNIMLPDSTSDLEGSQGYIVFSIKPFNILPPGVVLYNTAYIYFDLNEAIITNSSYNRIFDCYEGSLSILSESVNFCEGDIITFESDRPDFENYEWSIGNTTATGFQWEYNAESVPSDTLKLVATNPVCELSSQLIISQQPLPVFQDTTSYYVTCGTEVILPDWGEGLATWYYNQNYFGEGDNVLAVNSGDYLLSLENDCGESTFSFYLNLFTFPDAFLSFSGGILSSAVDIPNSTYIWSLNGNIIEGAGSSEYVPLVSGNYSLSISIDSLCSQSEELYVEVISIGEDNHQNILLAPNPMTESSLLFLPHGNWHIALMDATGRIVSKETTHGTSPFELHRAGLPKGVYQLRLQNGERTEILKMIVD